MIKKTTIPTILGIIMLVLGSFAGVFLLTNTQVFKTGAEAGAAAKNIRVTNIADNSLTVTWTTDIATAGYVVWGPTEQQVNRIEKEDSTNTKYYNHSITISGLNPETKYYYKIGSNNSVFDNSGIPWSVTTGPTLTATGNSQIISGNVINASGNAEKHALVYAEINGYVLSTTTSDTGYYVIQVGSTRTQDLKNYLEIIPSQTLIKLSVQASPDGVSGAQIFLQSANPAPPLIIGQSTDFRSSPANTAGENPNVNLSLPVNTVKESKFDVSVSTSSAKPTSVILESIREGEIITTTEPQFFGKAPGGTVLNITVHSPEAINGSVTVPKTGSWSYTVPSNLSAGKHTITVSWKDVSGITRFLTRDFVVQAAEIPAFTASRSGSTASPTPTGSPSPSSRPSSSPIAISSASPTSRPSATPKPSITPIPTNQPIPDSGSLTATLLLFIMSMGIFSFSFFVWKIADK